MISIPLSMEMYCNALELMVCTFKLALLQKILDNTSGETSFPCGRLNMPVLLDYSGNFVGNLREPQSPISSQQMVPLPGPWLLSMFSEDATSHLQV
jgi:hypothetical protein